MPEFGKLSVHLLNNQTKKTIKMSDNFNIIAFDMGTVEPGFGSKVLRSHGICSLKQSTIDKMVWCFEYGHNKIFLDGTTHRMIGYIDGNTGKMVLTDEFTENLKWMPSIEDKSEIILDMDIILAKIKTSGMGSLHNEENVWLETDSH